MNIDIPPILNDILAKNPTMKGHVEISISSFLPWLNTSGLYFFPNFTDHGPKHISEVLATASSIISDATRQNVLSSEDVAVLIIAILLHDIGMHITSETFEALVSKENQNKIVEFDSKNWSEVWADFLKEASRFDGRTLVKIFGDDTPINTSDINLKNLSQKDILLIGEFIRRHHCRFAHEIAIYGLPSKSPQSQKISLSQFDNAYLDLAGLIARSHGLDIRETFNYLKAKFHMRVYKKTHPVFLMSVLRIADYLQIQAERAPQSILHIKTLKSPVSQKEWDTHKAIEDIINSDEDPEAIFVKALPEDASMFLKLKKLFKDIQNELDQSWAALGEVYGRYPEDGPLTMKLRRIRSNIDRPNEFIATQKIKYLPESASFASAGTDLLKLLVSPLYDNDVTVGIRELLQNALDASKERYDWEKEHQILNPDFYPCDTDVHLKLDITSKNVAKLTITDKGMGMTASTVINYFLKAGASFRNSKVWRENHLDDNGKSRVLKGGRFGIGVLAAFLLGDKIKVTTRHISAARSQALTFKAGLNDEDVEIQYCDAPMGTSLEIEIIDEKIINRILPDEDYISGYEWPAVDWFFLTFPKLKCEIVSKEMNKTFYFDRGLPNAHENLLPGWHRIPSTEYEDIHWTFINSFDRRNYDAILRSTPALLCNGLKISVTQRGHYSYERPEPLYNTNTSHLSVRNPYLSIFDANALLPLNLQRTKLAPSELSFTDDLITAIAEDYIAFLLVNCPTSFPRNIKDIKSLSSYEGIYERHSTRKLDFYPIGFHKSGLCIIDIKDLPFENFDKIISILSPSISKELENYFNEKTIGVFYEDYGSVSDTIRSSFEKHWNGFRIFDVLNTVFSCQKEKYDHFVNKKIIKKSLLDSLDAEEVDLGSEKMYVLQRKDSKSKSENLINFLKNNPNQAYTFLETFISEDLFNTSQNKQSKLSPFTEAWTRLLGKELIPYDIDLRRKKFSKAYEKLEKNISYFESLNKEKSNIDKNELIEEEQ